MTFLLPPQITAPSGALVFFPGLPGGEASAGVGVVAFAAGSGEMTLAGRLRLDGLEWDAPRPLRWVATMAGETRRAFTRETTTNTLQRDRDAAALELLARRGWSTS